MPRNRPFYSFASYSIVPLTPFINNQASSRDITIFMILLLCSSEFISVVILNQTSVTDAAAVNPDGIKTLLASLNTFAIKGQPVLSNGSTNVMVLPKNPPNCTNFTLAGKLYPKALRSLYFCWNYSHL